MKNKIKKILQDKESQRYILTKTFYKTFATFLGGYSFHLNQVFLFPLFSCNLRCVMCGFFFGEKEIFTTKTQSLHKNTENVSLERWKTFIDEVAHYKPKIYITGGEPLLYPDLFELAQHIKSKHLILSLQTNGTLLVDKIDTALIFDEVNISLDGPSAEVNDKVRGKGIFEKVMSGIRELSLKRKFYPKINICYTISDMNYEYLSDMVDFLENSDFKIDNLTFQHLMFTSQGNIDEFKEKVKNIPQFKSNLWDGLTYKLQNMNVDILANEVSKTRKRNSRVSIKFFPNFTEDEVRNFYRNPDFLPQRFRRYCLTPYLDAIVFPDGNVFSCQGYVIGNIKENKFNDLWNNVYSRKIRVKIIRGGIFSVCRTCCGKYVY